MKKEKWITMKEAITLTGRHYMTVYSWVKKGLVESKQLEPGKKRSPIYINEFSIPSYLRA